MATFLSDNLYVSHLSEQKDEKTSSSFFQSFPVKWFSNLFLTADTTSALEILSDMKNLQKKMSIEWNSIFMTLLLLGCLGLCMLVELDICDA